MQVARNTWTSIVIAALAALTTVTGACGDLDDFTEIKDLRVLAVRAETPGFLINLDDPGNVSDPATLQSTLTALIVDPTTGGEEVSFQAFGCPDFLDAITSATGQGTRVCPSPNAPATPGIPDNIAMALKTTEITTSGTMPPTTTTVPAIEYQPVIPAYGLTPAQVSLFFTPQPTFPGLDQTISYNRDFGVAAIVDMTFTRGGQTASAIKRLVYWPDLSAEYPGQVANRNPRIGAIEFFRARDKVTGEPLDKWETMPVVSISEGDELYVQPALPDPETDAIEEYPLRVRNTATDTVETRIVKELVRFQFYTTAGTFSPDQRENTPNLLDPNARILLDSRLNLPAANKIPTTGLIDIWVVVHDERAGVNWQHATVMVVP